jgi:hypothetical protein
MTKPGTKPIPNEIKKKNGTYREDRHGVAGLVALPQVPGIPEAPETLEATGLEAWERIFTNAPWIHKETDKEIVRILCESLDEREQLRSHLVEDKDNWRARTGLRELEKQIGSILASLGLNPSDRARYGFAIVKTESKLEEFLRRKREDEESRGVFRGN